MTLKPGATLTSEGLRLDGKTGFATTPPLKRVPNSRTIEAWVKLDTLFQRGGAAIGIATSDGAVFDALVFGEREPGRWMTGSEAFRRTWDIGGAVETEAAMRPIHVAIAYAEDGTIRMFREGRPYGEAYKSSGPVDFPNGEAQIVFGLRHAPVFRDRLLAGTIVRARLYDRALGPADVAASAKTFDYVSPTEIAAALPDDRREERARIIAEVAATRATIAARPHKAFAVTPREAGATRVQIRGNPAQPGAVVTPGGVSALKGPIADFGLPPDAHDAKRQEGSGGVGHGQAQPAVREGRRQPALAGAVRRGTG